MVYRNCQQCNEKFKVFPCKIKMGQGKFCSKKCCYKFYTGENHPKYWLGKKRDPKIIQKTGIYWIGKKGKESANWQGGKIKKTCENCQRIFKVWLSRIKIGKGKFCNKRCWYEWKSKNIIGNKNPLYGKKFPERTGENNSSWVNRIEISCKQCGKNFLTLPSLTKLGNDKFCNKKCYSLWQSENVKGENNHSWKGGITPLYKQIRGLKRYTDILQQSKQRDNYQCLMPNCDSDCKYLHSHHVKEFNKILDENNIKTIGDAENCQELWNINNLITLCKSCHKHIRGREKQFENLFRLILRKIYVQKTP